MGVLLTLLFSTCENDIVRISKVKIEDTPNEINETTAVIGAEVIDNSDRATSYGLCWSTSNMPTLGDNFDPQNGKVAKTTYTSTLINLAPETLYHVRAYILEGDKDAIYSGTMSFTTLERSTINVSSPATNDVWVIGETYNIEWTDNIDENVKIELYQGGSKLEDLGTSTESDGEYTWTVLESLSAGEDYFIKIISIDNAGITAQSALFTIAEGEYISVTEPTTGSSWQKGSDQSITWNDNIDGNVKIDLFQNDALKENIKTSTESDGNYLWTVPMTLSPDDDYSIRISSVAETSIVDKSAVFSIFAIEPTVSTLEATNITGDSATLKGTVNAKGETVSVSFEWGLSDLYGTSVGASPPSASGNSVTPVSAVIRGLEPGTTYHYRIKAGEGDAFGADMFFPTDDFPVVSTSTISTFTHNSAVLGGEVTDESGSTVTERGVCWSASPTVPDTILGDHLVIDSGTDPFSANITGLESDITYNVRAYAVNGVGIQYGSTRSFTTEPEPSITITGPALGGHWIGNENLFITWEITNVDGDVSIVLLKAGSSSTILKNSVLASSEQAEWPIPPDQEYRKDYSVKITSLNNTDITDESESFTVSEATGSTGGVTDKEGNLYTTIKIGKQWWMAENLKTRFYADGSPLTSVIAVGDITGDYITKYCFDYDDNSSNSDTYGRLYTWAAAMNGESGSNLNPSEIQGVCPAGWHLPSDTEWKEMEIYIGMSAVQADLIGARGTTEGGELKESGTVHWTSPNTGANNQYGFTALPGGYFYFTGGFYQLLFETYFWSSTDDGDNAYTRKLEYDLSTVIRNPGNKAVGISIRCVMD